MPSEKPVLPPGRPGSDPDGRLTRLAAVIADGLAPFPTGLPPVETARLARLVGGLRRDRLVRHVARVIAADLARSARAEETRPC
jgi:hypothetical protein